MKHREVGEGVINPHLCGNSCLQFLIGSVGSLAANGHFGEPMYGILFAHKTYKRECVIDTPERSLWRPMYGIISVHYTFSWYLTKYQLFKTLEEAVQCQIIQWLYHRKTSW